jgi:CHAT domain-containing protein
MFGQTLGHAETRVSLRLSLRFSLLLLASFSFQSFYAPRIRAQTTDQATPKASEVTTLELGQPIEHEISGNEKQSYSIDFKERQFFRIELSQESIRVGLDLRLPDGQLISMFEPFDGQPELSFTWVAEQAGTYHIVINAAARTAAGRYKVKLAELRPATANDLGLQQARNLFLEYARQKRDGRSDEALAALIRCLELRERFLGPDDPLVGRTLGFLAGMYSLVGDYAKAEPLIIREIQITKKALGPDNIQVARDIATLSDVYLGKGDDVKAEETTQQALSIYDRANMMQSAGAGSAFAVLAGIYYQRRDYVRSEDYYERSRAVWEKLLGPEHFHLAPSYTHLGRVAYDSGNYAKAESMFARALTLAEKGVGPDNINATPYRNDLAALYCTTGSYDKGIALYQQSLAVHTAKAAVAVPSVQEILIGLSRCAAAQGHTTDAVNSLSQASELQERYIGINLATGSEREKLAFLNSLLPRLSRNISMNVNLAPNDPQARDLAALTILRQRGRVLDAVSATVATLRQRFSPEDQQLLDRLSAATAQLAHLVLGSAPPISPAETQSKIKSLEEQKEKLEEQISVHSAGYYRATPVTIKAIQAAIPSDAALIEFSSYRPFDPKAPDNETAYGPARYVAYVFRNEGDVRWVEIGPGKELDNAIDAWRQALRDPQRKEAPQLARAVDEKIMQPVRALAGDAKHLLISPDGELNLIPFAALVDQQGRYLIERYSVSYLTSGRDLLRMQVARESKSEPIIVANPSFGETSSELLAKTSSTTKAGTRQSAHHTVSTGNDLSEVYFAPLGGTAQEASSIQSLFPDATLLSGSQASESAVKQFNAPRILHIATHGFFLSEPGAVATDQATIRGIKTTAQIENPLLRSGLALAGANLRNGSSGDDGILTALEASGLNLWGTKLVVLSACDTGVGEVSNGEGVYGLRRAFTLAGAESLVMSLWPISDYTTRKLMTSYYQNLKAGMGRGEALRQVQLDMLKKNPKLHPFYWANFIQSGDWANLDGKR